MNKIFNIFRLNCLLNDNDSSNFNGIILSLVHELLYVNDNKELSRKECYSYVKDDLRINVEIDLFEEIIDKAKSLQLCPIEDDILIKLKQEKYAEISNNIEHHSIEKYIENYIVNNDLDRTYIDIIFRLLTKAIYDNINSFTISNIKSLITEDLANGFSQKDIDIFNNFIEDADKSKQNVLYNTFLKAIEFAIITSGKGVKEFSKEIFKNKKYALDTNIIFRLIGVGGKERQESTKKLMHSCIHQGVSFFYSIATYQELKRKIDSTKNQIKNAISKGALDLIENLIDGQIEKRLNDDFLIYYAKLRKEGQVKSIDQFEQYLLTEFRKIEKELSLNGVACEKELRKSDLSYWQTSIFNKKKEKNDYVFYTKSAAKVDAINILFVRKLRGNNNYNYSDVKSFYLTTDRTLNTIMAEFNDKLIPETILPSQLFIIHNGLSEDDNEIDYDTFSLFLKRRTTEYKISGREILVYVEEIRQHTSEPEMIEEVIKAYSDVKYTANSQKIATEKVDKTPTIKEFAQTYLDKRLNRAELGDLRYREILLTATSKFENYIKRSKYIVRSIDIIITIFIIPITIFFIRFLSKNIYLLISSILAAEIIKFIVSSKTSLFYKLVKYFYYYQVNNSNYNKITENDELYFKDADDKFKEVDSNIWK